MKRPEYSHTFGDTVVTLSTGTESGRNYVFINIKRSDGTEKTMALTYHEKT